MRPASLLALVLLVAPGCRCPLDGVAAGEPASPRPADDAPRTIDAGPDDAPAFSPALCVHQRRADLGAPLHRERGGKGGFVRLVECTRLDEIERDGSWLRVAFPEVEGRTEGWISKRYVMECGPCSPADAGQADAEPWPPRPEGLCLDAGATGEERLSVGAPVDRASARGGAKGRAGARVVVISFNVWELYDGVGERSYLSPRPDGASPAAQFDERVAAMAVALGRIDADVLALQEVESAEVACALASRAWPRSGWSCFGAPSRRPYPQNVAVATRLEATARVLSPDRSSEAGPRPALELSLEGTGGLTVTTVHLKSSRGRASHEDCLNARRRMGMAAALARRYERWSSVLVLGDFNVDPLDTGRAVYDRTDDILEGRGFRRVCPSTAGCAAPTYGGADGSAIDLAFFRAGGSFRPLSARIVDGPGPPLGSDHDILVAEVGL